ncbi:MAG: ParB/RepB/Spo0J family partition protein, partial [Candidatus Cloacimonadota bacterium]|nr:ParB/RepB/Spo0J family partition protein [Candidatus Cloacimonadota bacterium]
RSVSKKEQLQFAIIENIQREDLNAIEEALAYQQLSEEFSLKHSQISDTVGKNRATITNSLRLLQLNDSIQQLISDGKLSRGHARTILQVNKQDRKEFAQYIISKNLSVRKAEIAAKKFKRKNKKEGSNLTEKQEEKQIEEKLIMKFKTKIKVKKEKNKGRITFYYKTQKELEKLLESFE